MILIDDNHHHEWYPDEEDTINVWFGDYDDPIEWENSFQGAKMKGRKKKIPQPLSLSLLGEVICRAYLTDSEGKIDWRVSYLDVHVFELHCFRYIMKCLCWCRV